MDSLSKAAEDTVQNLSLYATGPMAPMPEGTLMNPGLGMRLREAEPPTRVRLKELFDLAYRTVEFLEANGLQKGEQCAFREICERLWWAK